MEIREAHAKLCMRGNVHKSISLNSMEPRLTGERKYNKEKWECKNDSNLASRSQLHKDSLLQKQLNVLFLHSLMLTIHKNLLLQTCRSYLLYCLQKILGYVSHEVSYFLSGISYWKMETYWTLGFYIVIRWRFNKTTTHLWWKEKRKHKNWKYYISFIKLTSSNKCH